MRLVGRLELTKLIFTQILSMVENVSFEEYIDCTRIEYKQNGIVTVLNFKFKEFNDFNTTVIKLCVSDCIFIENLIKISLF